jgi:hypothetical protein
VAVRVSYTRTVKPNFWLDGSSADWAILNFHREKVARMLNTVPVGLSGSQLRGINKLSDREFSISRTKTKKTQFLRKIISNPVASELFISVFSPSAFSAPSAVK